jgi:rRNA maturation endonuclease Nob1
MNLGKKSDQIKNRESWLKTGVIIFFSLVIGIPLFWKLLINEINFDFAQLNFESVLTLVVSFFAIILSVLFYFKANESSNQFYNNSYTFTKDISETLRGIEAGFGEKLSNLDKGNEDLKRTFETYISPAEIKKGVAEGKKEVKEIKEEKDKIIESLSKESEMSKKDINNYLKMIRQKDSELMEKNKMVRNLKQTSVNNYSFTIDRNKLQYISDYTVANILPDLSTLEMQHDNLLRKIFRSKALSFTIKYINLMKEFGYVDGDIILSESGIEFIKDLSIKYVERK